MAVDLPQQLAVGARCLVAGKYIATIRHIGPVHGQVDDWVGLEWDDTSRGKHDGSHNERRYFECYRGKPSGSFVRKSKFLEAVAFGCSLLEAIQRRYADRSATPEQDSDLSVPATGGRRVAVKLVGADEVARRLAMLSTLQVASVINEGVSTVSGEPLQDLAATLPSLRELDVSANLIGGWGFVVDLLQSLPSLGSLNLSQNRFSCLPSLSLPPLVPHPTPLPALTTLILNSTTLTWPQIVALAQQLPNLRELRLNGNAISSLTLQPAVSGAESQQPGSRHHQQQQQEEEESGTCMPLPSAADAPQASHPPQAHAEGQAPGCCTSQGQFHAHALGALGSGPNCESEWLAGVFPCLEVLDLEENLLDDWAQVQLLGALPVLQALLLGGNRLQGVFYSQGFASLSTLLLGGNLISSWESVDQLDRFPALSDVRLTNNPVLADQGISGRYEVVARVGCLTTLNASQVTKMERWDAELNYLRHVTDELAATKDEQERQAALRRHPRFTTLTAKYGTLAPSLTQPAVGNSMASSLVELVLRHAGKEVRKKLPVSLTIGKLKLMIEKLLRVKSAQQALILIPSADSNSEAMPEDVTEENGKELRYYDLRDGARIEITEMDPANREETLRRAKQAAADLQRFRMKEQEKIIQQFHLVEKGLMA